jgi:hypothetical protein
LFGGCVVFSACWFPPRSSLSVCSFSAGWGFFLLSLCVRGGWWCFPGLAGFPFPGFGVVFLLSLLLFLLWCWVCVVWGPGWAPLGVSAGWRDPSVRPRCLAVPCGGTAVLLCVAEGAVRVSRAGSPGRGFSAVRGVGFVPGGWARARVWRGGLSGDRRRGRVKNGGAGAGGVRDRAGP